MDVNTTFPENCSVMAEMVNVSHHEECGGEQNDVFNLFKSWKNDKQRDKAELQFMYIMYPILLTIGVLGNTAYAVLLARSKRRTTQTIYLFVISISSVFVLLFEFPGYLATFVVSMRNNQSFMLFMLHSMGLQLLGEDAFTLISNWSLVAFSIERVVVVAQPFRFRTGVHKRTAWIVLTAVVIGALIISIPETVIYYRWSKKMASVPQNGCAASYKAMMVSSVNRATEALVIVEGLYVTVIVPFITFTVLLVTTLILLILLCKRQRAWKEMFHHDKATGNRTPVPGADANKTLFRAVTVYFLTQVPRAVFLFSIVLSSSPKCRALASLRLQQQAMPVLQTVFLINYAITFTYHRNWFRESVKMYSYRKWKTQKSSSRTESTEAVS